MIGARRASAAALAALVLCGLAIVPAGAQTEELVHPDRYRASAAARALTLSVLGLNVTIGSTGTVIDSSQLAEATGAGALLIAGTTATARVSGRLNPGETSRIDDPPAACVVNLPLSLVNLAAACGDARAELAGAGPAAAAHGGVAAVEIGLSLLDPLIDQLLALVGNTIGAVTDPLLVLLGGLLTPLLSGLNLQVTNLVDDLVAGLQRATSLLRVHVGTSASQAVTSPGAVTASAVAQGAQIDVLPGLTLGGDPLVSIIVGEARADLSITRSRSQNAPQAAQVVPSFDPAIVRVRLGLPLLGGNLTDIPIGLGSPLTLLAGTPLESTISLGAGQSSTSPPGSGFAIADGVKLDLLKGIGGGIVLELAHVEVAGSGETAQFRIVQEPPVVTQPEPPLAKTGASPVLPMAGFALVLAALAVRRGLRQTV